MPKGIYKHKNTQGFHKGHIPHNTGIKGYTNSGTFKKGNKQTEKQVKALLVSVTGKNSYIWKGDKVGYKCMHDWVSRWKGRPDNCDVCGNSSLKHRQYNWANIDHKYSRVLDDYIRMCVKCHRKYDYENTL